MKKVSMFVLAVFVCVTTFLTITGFSNLNPTTISKISKVNQSGTPISLHRSGWISPGLWSFTSNVGSGTWRMVPTFTGQAFHCVNTLTFYNIDQEVVGTVIALSNCNFTTMNGAWHIVGGTLGWKGNGKLTMQGTTRVGQEWWEGTIK